MWLSQNLLMHSAGGGDVSPYSIDTRSASGGLDLTGIAAAQVGLGDFTWEAWIYATEISGTYNGIIGYDNTDNILHLKPTGVLQVYDSGQRTTTAADAVTLNTWTHVAVVRDGGVGTTIYVDGSVAASDSWAGSVDTDHIQVGFANLAERFDGYIFRPHVLNSQKYTGSFTPQTSYGVEATSVVLVEATESGFVDLLGNTITTTETPPVPALFSPL